MLRSLAKKSAAGAIIKRHDLNYTSSEDEITGFNKKVKVTPNKGAKNAKAVQRRTSAKPRIDGQLELKDFGSPRNTKDPFGNSIKDSSRTGLNATGA